MERLQKEPEVGPEKQGEKSLKSLSHFTPGSSSKASPFVATTLNDLFLSPHLLPTGIIFAKGSQGISSLKCLDHKKLARGEEGGSGPSSNPLTWSVVLGKLPNFSETCFIVPAPPS